MSTNIRVSQLGRLQVGRAGAAAVLLSVVLGGCESEAPPPAPPAPAVEPLAAAPSADAVAAGKALFDTKCIACHSVGEGERIGPDLQGVFDRRPQDWLERWVKDPTPMLASDPVAKELLAKYKNVPMPPTGLDAAQVGHVLAYVKDQQGKGKTVAKAPLVPLDDSEFASAKQTYFNRCAGCHGTLRAGATGPTIQPKRTLELGTTALEVILTSGTPGGMPAFGKANILNEREVNQMARFIQMEPPEPPQLALPEIRKSWNLIVPVKERPKKALTKRNWENYFGVILRDAGEVAIIDGDDYEQVAVISTGFAVHILRSSSTGRYFYAIGRDGRVSLIDLWPETPTLVAQVQGCFDARSVDGSKRKGFEDKYVIEGCYWPPQYVVYDGLTLEPKTVIDVLSPTYDTKEELKEVRVASIIASHHDPVWIVSLKESGFVGIVDYSKKGFPMVSKIAAERFLHDGGWDHSGRFFMVAANMRNQMAVIDVNEKKFVTKFETGIKPHPGRGANWLDPEFGWVNATTHIGEGLMAVYGADPEKNPEHAWKVVRKVALPAGGGLFIKTHAKSQWVWMDMPLSNESDKINQICVYSKQRAAIEKCWSVGDKGRAVHFEYNKEGTEVWVSLWDKQGAVIVYDDKTLTEKKRITGAWVETPTGKFNVYNTAHDIY